jgi:hypothetical protein
VLLVLAAVACSALGAPACGFGEGAERSGGAQLRVTRDFGRVLLGTAREPRLREDQTVMRLLRSKFDVDTRFGGRFVQGIDGLEGKGAEGSSDWFYFVNGVEADVGAAEYELSPGDRVQWDYRRWDQAMRAPAIVGAFPEPFLNGFGGERRPVRVECEKGESRACTAAKGRLERVGVSTTGSSLGAPGTQTVIRLVVARWPAARIVRGAIGLEQGPAATGVYARFTQDGRSLDLLGADGHTVRHVEPGDGVGLVLALRPRDDELLWLVTALDQKGLEAGVDALNAGALRDAYAVAVSAGSVEKLPLPER